jgi:hypothetical protein
MKVGKIHFYDLLLVSLKDYSQKRNYKIQKEIQDEEEELILEVGKIKKKRR